MSTLITLGAYAVIIAFTLAVIIGMNLVSHFILLRAQDKRNAQLDREMVEREARLDREYGIDATVGREGWATMSDTRPPWVPDYIEDGADLRNYLGTAGAMIEKSRWAAREYNAPGLLARIDQVQAHIAHKRDEKLSKGLSDE